MKKTQFFKLVFICMIMINILPKKSLSQNALTIDGVKITIIGDTLNVKGSIYIKNNNSGGDNIHNAGVIYITDSIKSAADDIFLSSSNPHAVNDSTKQSSPCGKLIFTGTSVQTISGNPTYFFNDITINKNNNELKLDTNIKVFGKIDLIKGNLFLNNHNINLFDDTPSIVRYGGNIQETNDNRIYDNASGVIKAMKNTVTDTSVIDSINLGIHIDNISSSNYFDSLIIVRGHVSDTMTADGSIKKSFSINKNEKGAINKHNIKFSYFQNDFAGLTPTTNENDFTLWCNDNTGYKNLKRDLINTTSNFVLKKDSLKNGCYTVADQICEVIPDVNLGANFEICQGDSFILDASSYLDTLKKPYSFIWSFPNSVKWDASDSIYNKGINIENVQLSDSGTYSVTVIDYKGCFAMDNIHITVNPLPQIDSVKIIDDYRCQLDSVKFKQISHISKGTIDEYFWNFGDGDTSYFESPANIYDSSKIFNVKLTLTSNKSCVSSFDTTIQIDPKPIAKFQFNDTCKISNDTITFKNNTVFNETNLLDNKVSVMKTYWIFDNNDTLLLDTLNNNQLDEVNHQFSPMGNHNVKMMAVSNSGCRDTVNHSVKIYPKITPFFKVDNVCDDEASYFYNLSTIEDTSKLNYLWYFGTIDTINAETNPIMGFDPDTINVKLTVTSNEGCVESYDATHIVYQRSKPDFSFSDVCLGNEIMFSNRTTGNLNNDYFWDLGDDFTSDKDSLSHFYVASNTYNVKLRSTTVNGCIDTITKKITIFPKPVAEFSYTKVCNGFETKFINESSIDYGTLTYLWKFGDGNESEDENPVHSYAKDSTYWVTLIVTSNNGCIDSVSHNIIVYPKPVADFICDNVCFNDYSVFKNNSSVNNDSISYYQWSSEGNILSENFDFYKKYSMPGTYNVQLIARTTNNCYDTISKNLTVFPLPEPDFSSNNVCLNELTQFNDSSTISEGSIEKYYWNFGDSFMDSINQNPNHEYTSAGDYSVSLQVISDKGCSNDTIKITKVYPLPTANFSFSNELEQGSPITFINSSTPNNGTLAYLWDFNDGEFSNNKSPQHSFSNFGTYNIKLTTSTTYGCIDTITHAIDIYSLDIGFTASNVCFNDTVHFNNYSNVSNGTLNYLWNFGDGDISTEKNPSKVYTQSGTFLVTLEATLNNGVKKTFSDYITVYELPSPDFDIQNTCENKTINLVNQSTPDDESLNYFWDFNDGTTSAEKNPIKSYLNSGEYNIQLTCTNANACQNSIHKAIKVYAPPVANFTFSDVCFGEEIDFNNTSSSEQGSLSYLWDFGDYSTSNEINPNKTYQEYGKYNVKLKVIPDFECDPVSFSDSVSVFELPDIDFGDNLSTCGNSIVLNPEQTDASSYLWSDGSTNSSLYVTQTGNYSLTVTNNNACVNTDSVDVTLYSAVKPNLGNDTSVCESYELNAHYSGSSYLWSTDETSKKINVTQTGNYSVTVTDINGCTGADTIYVEILSSPEIELGETINACQGSELTLEPQTNATNYLWSDNSTNSTLTVTNTEYYALTVTNNNGCTSSDNIYVNFNPTPVVNLGEDKNTCQGKSIILNAGNSGNEYLWSDNSSTQTLSVNQTGYYAVTVTNEYACSNSDEILVTFNPNPVVNLGEDISTCQGNDITLDAENEGATFLWSDNSTTQQINIYESGYYQVSVTDENGCTATDNISVIFNEKPSIELVPDITVCQNTPVVLSAENPGASYLWSDNSTEQLFNVSETGNYWVQITANNGCANSDTVNITINALPTVDLGIDTIVCDNIILDADNYGSTYLWNNTTANQTLNVNETGNYRVTVTNENNCSTVSNNIFVTVNPSPLIELGNDISICDGNFVHLDAQNYGSTYLWSDNSTERALNVFSSDKYLVAVTNEYNCSNVSEPISITVNPLPHVDLGDDIVVCKNTPVILSGGNEGTDYLWSDNSVSQTCNINTSGDYWLSVTNQFGCSNIDTCNVNFLELPKIDLGSDTTICNFIVLDAGDTTQSYLWNDFSDSPTLYVDQSGQYSVYKTNVAGCSNSDTINITVKNFTPVNLGNDTSFCKGDIIFIDAGLPGYSYLWNDNSTNRILPVSTTGLYWVKTISPNGCVSYDSISVFENPTPSVNLGPDRILCNNSSINLSSDNPGSNYFWQSSNNFTSDNNNITVVDTGYYWLTVENSFGCSASDTIFIEPTEMSINAQFLVTSDAKVLEELQFIDLSSPEPSSFQWYFGDGTSSTSQNPVKEYRMAGDFNVLLIVSNDVCSDYMQKIISVENNKNAKLNDQQKMLDNKFTEILSSKLYPNPNKGQFNFELNLSQKSDVFLCIYSIMGKLIYIEKFNNINEISKQLNLTNYNQGIYLLRILTGTEAKTFKIVKF